MKNEIISREEFLKNWIGQRNLTRKTIEKFDEKELFSFKVEGMRTFADMIKELLAIAVPGLEEIVYGTTKEFTENLPYQSKDELLKAWDEANVKIVELYNKIEISQFHEEINMFGMYKSLIYDALLYFIDNEVHHRAQGYTYLRLLGIQPPFFWERD